MVDRIENNLPDPPDEKGSDNRQTSVKIEHPDTEIGGVEVERTTWTFHFPDPPATPQPPS